MTHTSLALLLTLAAMWGASFLFIKIGVVEIPPMTFAMLRVLVGSISLLIIVRAGRQRIPTDPGTWARLALMGAIGILIPFAAITWGTQHIPSGLSAILNAAMPLFTVLLSALLGEERLTARRMAGILIGFGGIVVLTAPQLGQGLGSGFWGQIAVVLAALSYAIAILYARRKLSDQSPMINSLGQVSTGCLFFIPLALMEHPWTYPMPSAAAIGAVLATGVLGTAIAYIIYYRLVQTVGATGTSLVTYIVPLFGVFWGWLILHERLSWNAFAALGTIVAGLVLVNGLPVRTSRRPAPATAHRG
ncbi:MAG TPA: EamA family transporter [Chloroflexi bacterium]|jgi:drug/metabolite transporter (DMT)-like permease|nr:EamA family transporter [Chloroflexota bacterium]